MKYLFSLCAVALFVGCSEEKSEPLPDLPPVELPKEVTGLYSGRIPCDDCTAKMVRVTLDKDLSASVVQTVVRDSMEVDTLTGTYTVTDSAVSITLSNGTHWNYKRVKFGNLRYMTSAGVAYEDKDGLHADLIKIFKPVSVKRAQIVSEPNLQDPHAVVKTAESKE